MATRFISDQKAVWASPTWVPMRDALNLFESAVFADQDLTGLFDRIRMLGLEFHSSQIKLHSFLLG